MARCRQEFAEAMALGCSIPELRERRKADRSALRARAGAEVAHHTKTLLRTSSEPSQRSFSDFDAPWMMRD